MKTWLVDTRPFVTYLDTGDPAHSEVASLWDDLTAICALQVP